MTEKVLGGRYRLDEQIATGGMGVVWRAHDQLLERPVAVKLLHDTLAADTVAAERFKREALMAASLSHPNMANVFDYVEEGGRPGIVMELVESETLAMCVARDGALPVADAVRIAAAVCDALMAAHEAGIVHRDVKPANVLLMRNGNVKVADFGIARSLGDATLTATGTVMGTAHYSAPEQVRGETATPATDQYALGVVLYEMLTGERPFTGDTAVAVAMARLSEAPRRLRDANPNVPLALDEIVSRSLAREPQDRFPDVAAMKSALLGMNEPAPIDRTMVLTPGPMDETIALSGAALSQRQAVDARPQEDGRPMAAVVPPRWWGKRVMLVLLPLILLGMLVWFVAAAVSAPDVVAVPKFQGRSVDDARRLAERAGLALNVEERSSTRREGFVLGQSVPAGREVEASSTVTVSVSRGDLVNTPDLNGMTEDEARAALQERGLGIGDRSYRLTNDVPFNTVVGQNPAPGKNLRAGDEVDVVLALTFRQDDNKGKGKKGGDDD